MRDVKELTGLRGYAALAVCLFHYLHQSGRPEWVLTVSAAGAQGVSVFFVLSGAIMAYVYGDWFSAGLTREKYGRFLVLRLARIYPVHLLLLLAIATMYGTGVRPPGPHANPETFVMNVLLVHAWGFTTTATWNEPSWSISAEFFAYLLCPVLIYTVGRRLALLRAAAACIAIWWLVKTMNDMTVTRLGFDFGVSLLYWFLFFVFGVFSYHIGRLVAGLPAWVDEILVIAGVSVLLYGAVAVEGHVVGFGAAAIIAGSWRGGFSSRTLFGNPVAVFLGEISYALYMVHFAVMWLVISALTLLPTPVYWFQVPSIFVVPLAIAIATGLHTHFEKPARDLIRTLATEGWLHRQPSRSSNTRPSAAPQLAIVSNLRSAALEQSLDVSPSASRGSRSGVEVSRAPRLRAG